MFKSMLIAGAGGFAGTCLRFLVGRFCAATFHGLFPVAALTVNLAGCFLIGILFGLSEKTQWLTPSANLLLTAGFCGGFTTYSSFANEVWTLGSRGAWSLSAVYTIITILAGVLAVWGGRALIR